MNCFKNKEKNQYLKVIYKGILRFRKKTICGVFQSVNSIKIVIDNKKTIPEKIKEVPLSEINFPFVPREQRARVLEVAHQRIFRGLKNRLLLGIL